MADGLTLKITQGDRVALNLVKTLITTPTLINLDPLQGAIYAIPIEAEANQKSGSAEVSESLVISSDAKKNITDNVAPGSKTWTLSGYIPGNKYLEPTNYFTPFVRLNTDILWMWFERGAVLIFKDADAQIYKRVVIKDLTTSWNKECANKTPVSITLKEINVIETGVLEQLTGVKNALDRAKKSIAVVGSIFGTAASLGSTIATTADESQVESIA